MTFTVNQSFSMSSYPFNSFASRKYVVVKRLCFASQTNKHHITVLAFVKHLHINIVLRNPDLLDKFMCNFPLHDFRKMRHNEDIATLTTNYISEVFTWWNVLWHDHRG